VVLVTLTERGEGLDRREVTLTEPGTPTHPHHHEGSWAVGRYLNAPWARPVSLAEAIALVERVRAAAERGAGDVLERLARSLALDIVSIALRKCPPLPAGIEQCIRDNRAQSQADSVMYRQALATAAQARGWNVFWYARDEVGRMATRALGRSDLAQLLVTLGQSFGPPWQAKHKLAATAALAAVSAARRS
jgi:hypothetical protein